MIVGPIALAVGAGGGCLGIFSLLYVFSLSLSLSLSLSEIEILSQRAVKTKTTNQPSKERNDMGVKKCPNNTNPHLLQAQ